MDKNKKLYSTADILSWGCDILQAVTIFAMRNPVTSDNTFIQSTANSANALTLSMSECARQLQKPNLSGMANVLREKISAGGGGLYHCSFASAKSLNALLDAGAIYVGEALPLFFEGKADTIPARPELINALDETDRLQLLFMTKIASLTIAEVCAVFDYTANGVYDKSAFDERRNNAAMYIAHCAHSAMQALNDAYKIYLGLLFDAAAPLPEDTLGAVAEKTECALRLAAAAYAGFVDDDAADAFGTPRHIFDMEGYCSKARAARAFIAAHGADDEISKRLSKMCEYLTALPFSEDNVAKSKIDALAAWLSGYLDDKTPE